MRSDIIALSLLALCAVAVPYATAHQSGQGHQAADHSDDAAAARVIRLHLSPGNAATITLTQGTVVRLEITTDEPTEMHLHGYDLIGQSGHGTPAIFAFTAEHTGRFGLVAHGHKDLLGRKETTLAYIEVRAE